MRATLVQSYRLDAQRLLLTAADFEQLLDAAAGRVMLVAARGAVFGSDSAETVADPNPNPNPNLNPNPNPNPNPNYTQDEYDALDAFTPPALLRTPLEVSTHAGTPVVLW